MLYIGKNKVESKFSLDQLTIITLVLTSELAIQCKVSFCIEIMLRSDGHQHII